MGHFRIILFLSLVIGQLSFAEVRYVSHTGTSTPPYTSWETAADSIMSAINISSFGDTIYVANGVYRERIDMISGLNLIGSGMDSCVIDTREFNYTSGFYSVRITDSCYLSGFKIRTYDLEHGFGVYFLDWNIQTINATVEYNKLTEAFIGINITTSSIGFDNGLKVIRNNFLYTVYNGIRSSQTSPQISNNIIYPIGYGIGSAINSAPIYLNNLIIIENGLNISSGFSSGFDLGSIVKNNLFISLDNSGKYGMDSYSDSIVNNIVYGEWYYGIFTAGSDIRNNQLQNTQKALKYDIGSGGAPPVFQYNNLWQNQLDYENFTADSTNIYSDPMFEDEDSLNFHLQMYSPLIDAGDPDILDKDGSRSDIGLFGGPYGEKYTYRDLAPKPPSNLTATYDSGLVLLRWNRNTEADFYRYRVYRDTAANFTYDSTRMIAEIADTFYYDDLPEKYLAKNYYYKITAIDTAGHQSAPSEEVQVNITGVPEGPPRVVEHYQLLNNYPNPFNSTTIIPYRLKEPGYVKLYIYDIKGELVRVLVNEYQGAGYYEVRFSPTGTERKQGKIGEGWWTGYNDDIATGIYLYQIMVRGEGNVPVFTDMGKMILLK